MYFYQNPFFYNFQGQILMIPSILQPQYIIKNNFQINQPCSTIIPEQKITPNSNLETDQDLIKKIQQNQRSTELKTDKIFIDSDYQPENNDILILYKKKNTESNLSNQIYSYISSNKSLSVMLKIVKGNQQKVEEIHKLVKKIKKSNKKYMNRSYIADLIKLKQGSTNFKIFKRSKSSIEIQELRKVLRISVQYFLENVCNCGLITSKKMNKDTIFQHFTRKRQIQQFLRKQIIQNR